MVFEIIYALQMCPKSKFHIFDTLGGDFPGVTPQYFVTIYGQKRLK